MGEDRRLELAQLRSRLDADVVAQQPPGVGDRPQRLDRAAGAVQGQGQLGAQSLAVGLAGDLGREDRGELGVLAEGEADVDERFHRRAAPLLVVGADVVEAELLAGRAERRAGVQLEGPIQRPAGAAAVAVAVEVDALVDEGIEAVEVDVVRGHEQDVAAIAEVDHRVAFDPGRGQRLAQVRDVATHRDLGARRWGVTPDAIDDAVDRDHAARIEQQQRQHRPLLGAAEVDGTVRPDRRHAAEAAQHRRPGVVHGGQDRTASADPAAIMR